MGFQSPAGASGPVSGIPDPAVKVARDALIYDGSEWIASRVAYSELTGVPATFAPSVHGDAAHDATVASLDGGGLVPDAELGAGAAAGEFLAAAPRIWRPVDYSDLTGVPADFPPEVHGDSEHDATVASLSGGLVPTTELGGAGADATKFLRGDQTWAVPAGGGGGIPFSSLVLVSNQIWTNMPAAVTNFGGGAANPIWRLDLDWATEIRLQAGVRVAGAAASIARLRYSSDNVTYADTGADVPLSPAAFNDSGWVALAAGAQIADCYLLLVGVNGDAVADPNITHITAYFRA